MVRSVDGGAFSACGSRNTQQLGMRFRALLTEGGSHELTLIKLPIDAVTDVR